MYKVQITCQTLYLLMKYPRFAGWQGGDFHVQSFILTPKVMPILLNG